MTELGFALLGLAVGLATGVAILALRRAPGAARSQLEARLDVQAAELRRLADDAAARGTAGESLRAELQAARHALETLGLREQERRERERESAEVIRRLSTVLAGGAAKGRAGENVLREHLAELPPALLGSDVRLNGKVVEFALRLPDGRCLPVDSKWPAVAELQALEAATDPLERQARARDVERVVAGRAREVAQYLDPALTAPVAVAAIPDAAYAVLRRAHAEAFSRGVVIVPYSTALPVLLFLFGLVQRFGDPGDLRGALAEVSALLGSMEQVLENKLARAATMLANGADELRSHLGKARGSVARGRSAVPDDRPEPSGGLVRVVP